MDEFNIIADPAVVEWQRTAIADHYENKVALPRIPRGWQSELEEERLVYLRKYGKITRQGKWRRKPEN